MDKYDATRKHELRYFAAALIFGLIAVLLLGLFLGANSVSKVACGVVQTVYNGTLDADEENLTPEQRKQREVVERAFEKCESNGVYDWL